MNKIRIILLIIIIVISTSIIWAKNTNLDIVAVAPGKVVPSNNVKVLQHLEGGIIEKIKVVTDTKKVESKASKKVETKAAKKVEAKAASK